MLVSMSCLFQHYYEHHFNPVAMTCIVTDTATAANARTNSYVNNVAITIHVGFGNRFNTGTFTESLPQLYSALNARKGGQKATQSAAITQNNKISSTMLNKARPKNLHYSAGSKVFGFVVTHWVFGCLV